MKQLVKILLQGKVMLLLALCVVILVPVLTYRLHYPACSLEQLVRYQVRLNQVVDLARTNRLKPVKEHPITAFGREYDEALRLPVLYANLSHRAVIYRAVEEDNTYYLFVCGKNANGEISKGFQYAESRPIPALHEKVLQNWSMEEESGVT